MPPGESIDSTRFQVRRRIGSGAFGVVYEAFDPVRNQVVALKALRHATPEALYRFKREFRSLTNIAHRNLVRLYELIAEGDQWLVSMELIRGTTFIDHVRREAPLPEESPAELPPMHADIGRLRVALAQLAAGVIALHNAGKLHRDIKPSNVLVADDRRVVLLDFGLVMDTDTRATEESTSTSGTPAYMSPEQGGGQPLGPASDWYSVGVMLYETLTGQVPYRGTYVDVINQKRAADGPPPSLIASGIPEDIDALCVDLLRRDPRERPSGDEILERLGRWAATIGITKDTRPFVGRDGHLRALREAFDASAAGAQTTVCVAGPSGAGKTSLIRAFLDRLRDDVPGVLVLTGRCYQRESVPYKGVDSLVDALHRYLSRLQPHELDALLPRDIAAAEQLFPVLSDVADIVRSLRRAGPPLGTDPVEIRRRAFVALRELFLRLSDRVPLVLAIDDLQWADADSAELIMDVLRPPDAPALLFIAAYRSDEAQASPFVRALRAGMPVRDVEVDELTLEDSPQLVARLRRLGSGAARMLQYVAVNARPILIPVLRLAFRGEDFDDALAMLAAQRLIRTRDTPAGETVEAYHDRIAHAAVAMLSEDELRNMHAVLALTLEGFAGAEPGLLADHFRAAGMDDRAAKYVESAGG